eukprot:evm.model.scf_383.2 EVM.evm.TU.scf_383.2   scf_383:71816-72679(+)
MGSVESERELRRSFSFRTAACVLCSELLRLAGDPEKPSTAKSADKLLSKGASADACCAFIDLADPKLAEARGCSVLHVAAASGNQAVAALLVANGAAVNTECENGHMPLHLTTLRPNGSGIAELLIENGADLEAKDANDRTPLHYAGHLGAPGVAEVLIEAGADIGPRNGGGETPLHETSGSNSADVAEVLIAAGADVDALDMQLETPLHDAAEWGSLEVVEILLRGGANRGARREDGKRPVEVVCALRTCSPGETSRLFSLLS